MERNQFFYKRIEIDKEGKELIYTDSFNISFVTRTFMLEEGKSVVLLNDFHQEDVERPVVNKKHEVINYEKRKEIVHSEIQLDAKDTARFYKLTHTEG